MLEFGIFLHSLIIGFMIFFMSVKAPQIAIDYWSLSQFAKLKDVIIAVRNDEKGHRDVNHEFVTLIDQKDHKETYTDSSEILSKDNTK